MIVPLSKKNRCPASALLTNIAGSNGIRVRYTELTLFLSYLDCQNSFSSDFLWPCLLICLFLCLSAQAIQSRDSERERCFDVAVIPSDHNKKLGKSL